MKAFTYLPKLNVRLFQCLHTAPKLSIFRLSALQTCYTSGGKYAGLYDVTLKNQLWRSFMAGKRLLDAAKLLDAGRSIAVQHAALRKRQWAIYSETSALVKATKSQTDRVTVTARAAWELGKRLTEDDPSVKERVVNHGRAGFEQAQNDQAQGEQSAQYEVQRHDVRGLDPREREVLTRTDRVVDHSPADDGSLSALRRREQQRASEHQIPVSTASADGASESLGQDAVEQRGESTIQELSSLPRTKIPKHIENAAGGDEDISHKELNQDVFYSQRRVADSVEDPPTPEAVNLEEIFNSHRVSNKLGLNEKGFENPYSGRQKLPPKPLPEMLAAEEQRKQQDDIVHASSASLESNIPTQRQPGEDAEIQELAASIAQDATSSEVPQQTSNSASTVDTHSEMHESRVPASRFGRLWQYGGLATSMAFGAVTESFRRLGGGTSDGSLMLSESNVNRLVAKLSRMRGAALKLGQMMSFQDSKLLPPTINTVLQRLQDSADYMPVWQRDEVLQRNLGDNWRDRFSSFEEKPFAAASIGQVHKARLASNGKDVAVKVQYPGVRGSIDSDLNNLSLLLTASRLLPNGLYLDKTIANARVELGWECDYEREARACQRFAGLVKDERDVFAVPEVYTEASGPDVLTAEFMTGTAVTKIKDLTQEDRDWVGTQILRLCLRELMEWRFMQTDPNWTNFLYNRDSKKLELLDFGASRDFPDKFVEPYVSLLIAASKGDRPACRELSIELGYLTGNESKGMLDAHVDSILTLAEPFVDSAPEVYDFEDQTITERVRTNIGLMLRERLAPPPEETYSLHRKLSGAFLLCARLESRVPARELFRNAVAVWEQRASKMAPAKF